LLGPLVVSAVGFELPDELLGRPMWDVLRQSVCMTRQGSAGRVVVNDSKKLHKKNSPKQNLLQRALLAYLATAPEPQPLPKTLSQLLTCLDSEVLSDTAEYPWYRDKAADWPLKYDVDDITISATALRNDMKQNNIRTLGLWSKPLPAGHFNRLIDTMKNKASVSFLLVTQLIWRAWQRFGRNNLHIVIDKQGGRSHYRSKLQKMFPDTQMKILKESETVSSYHLTESGRSMKIHFLAKGDQRQLSIALASIASKYLRELFMDILNSYFQKHCPGIAPTAGYYKDGQRFLTDMKPHNLTETIAPQHLLVRQR